MAVFHRRMVLSPPLVERLTIWAKRHAIDQIRMPSEGVQNVPCINIPETDGSVRTPACERLTIRAKRYAIDNPRMPLEGIQDVPCVNVP